MVSRCVPSGLPFTVLPHGEGLYCLLAGSAALAHKVHHQPYDGDHRHSEHNHFQKSYHRVTPFVCSGLPFSRLDHEGRAFSFYVMRRSA